MSVITVDACKCDRKECGHIWIPADSLNLPQRCAKCKSPAWNKVTTDTARKNTRAMEAPMVSTPIVQTPTVHTPTVQEVLAPIERHSPAKAERATKKPWKEVKAPTGKKKICQHGFAIVNGVTGCPRCK